MIAYLRRVRDAHRDLRAAQDALDSDYEQRLTDGGPLGEDDTYLRLNDAVICAEARCYGVLRGWDR